MRHRSVRMAWMALFALLAASATVMAQGRRPGPWAGTTMDLSEEQWGKIEKLRLAFWERTAPLRIRWREAAWALDDMAWKGPGDKEIEAARRTLEALEKELEAADSVHRDEVRTVLNEDQKALFERYGGLGMGYGRQTSPGRGVLQGRGYGLGRGMGWGARSAWGSGWGGGGRGNWTWRTWRGPFCPSIRWR